MHLLCSRPVNPRVAAIEVTGRLSMRWWKPPKIGFEYSGVMCQLCEGGKEALVSDIERSPKRSLLRRLAMCVWPQTSLLILLKQIDLKPGSLFI